MDEMEDDKQHEQKEAEREQEGAGIDESEEGMEEDELSLHEDAGMEVAEPARGEDTDSAGLVEQEMAYDRDSDDDSDEDES